MGRVSYLDWTTSKITYLNETSGIHQLNYFEIYLFKELYLIKNNSNKKELWDGNLYVHQTSANNLTGCCYSKITRKLALKGHFKLCYLLPLQFFKAGSNTYFNWPPSIDIHTTSSIYNLLLRTTFYGFGVTTKILISKFLIFLKTLLNISK